MSFSSDVKKELCRGEVSRTCCAVAECYGALLYCNTFRPNEIKFVTASREFTFGCRSCLKRPSVWSLTALPTAVRGARVSCKSPTEKSSPRFSMPLGGISTIPPCIM